MSDDLSKSIAITRIRNAERRLLAAQDHYEQQAAKAALDQALRHLESIRGAERG